jgi:small subunit ribosomal protein S30e
MVNMQLLVRGNDTQAVDINEDLLISQFKLAVAQKFQIQDVSQMNLFLNGQPMQDEQFLSAYNVINQSTIDMDIGLVGGKVHGSLARAGKVKGQTPKVAAVEDKKKKITGRAKRRLQYNRRFVNVVTGPGGRKKGPNAGAGVAAPAAV